VNSSNLLVPHFAATVVVFFAITAVAAPGRAEPGDDLTVSVLTFGPGDHPFFKFGHNAILVQQQSRGEPTLARGGPSREGLGTLSGFPGKLDLPSPRLSARRHRFLNGGVKIPTAARGRATAARGRGRETTKTCTEI
jgi:hypothetical protein